MTKASLMYLLSKLESNWKESDQEKLTTIRENKQKKTKNLSPTLKNSPKEEKKAPRQTEKTTGKEEFWFNPLKQKKTFPL